MYLSQRKLEVLSNFCLDTAKAAIATGGFTIVFNATDNPSSEHLVYASASIICCILFLFFALEFSEISRYKDKYE